jgi:hypothetical protein
MMTDKEFALAVKLHGQTHRLKQISSSATGHYDISGGCMAIAAAAECGKVLAPIPGHFGHSHVPELYAAAAERGLLVDETGAQVPYVPTEPQVDTRPRIGNQPLAPPLPDGCPGGG